MLKYVFNRLLQFIPVILGTTFLTFVLLQVVPGDPISLMMKEHISPDVVERVRKEMHLDDPWLQRYVRYMWDAAHGDFGESYKTRRAVSAMLATAFPATLALTLRIAAGGLGHRRAGGHHRRDAAVHGSRSLSDDLRSVGRLHPDLLARSDLPVRFWLQARPAADLRLQGDRVL